MAEVRVPQEDGELRIMANSEIVVDTTVKNHVATVPTEAVQHILRNVLGSEVMKTAAPSKTSTQKAQPAEGDK